MKDFQVEKNTQVKASTKRLELIKQIESLQMFYYDIGYDTTNLRTIFSLTLSYLKGQVNKMVVQSFFDVLMGQNKLTLTKEINLLNCFDELVETLEEEEMIAPVFKIDEAKTSNDTGIKANLDQQQQLNFKEAA